MKDFDWKQFLQQHSVFSTINDERRIEALLRVSTEHDYSKGKNIVRQGEKGNSLFVMGSGSAEVLLDVRGEGAIPLSTIERDDVFGEMAFFEEGKRTATVQAKEYCNVLEIPGPAIQKLQKDYPDIGFRLLLLMGERLRQTNDRILALHLKTVDEKLDLFNKRLEIDQKVAEAGLKAAQTMFDQTKIRAGEIIESAERSRNRLTWFGSAVGGFVTLLASILGGLGLKEVLSIHKLAEVVKQDAEGVKKEAEGVSTIRKNAEAALAKAEASLATVAKLQEQLLGVYTTHFIDALGRDSPSDARNSYNEISGLHGLDGDGFTNLLRWLEIDIATKAKLLPKSAHDRKSNVEDFGELFDRFETDARTPRDKLDICYLRSVYDYINDRINFEAARGRLEECLNIAAKGAPSRKSPELARWIGGESGERGANLRKLSDLAKITLEIPRS